MMRKPIRLAVALAVSGLVAAGGVAAAGGFTAALAASAKVQATCDGSAAGTPESVRVCQLQTQDITEPSAITLVVTLESGDGQNDQYVGVSWQGFCGPNGSEDTATITPSANPTPKTPISTAAPVSISIPLPYTLPRYCDISAEANLYASLGGGDYNEATTGSYQLQMEYTPWPSPSATPSPSASSPAGVPLIKGYGGKCLDDKANSSANRTEVIIWTCDSAQSAQGWTFTKGELVHNGKCANDRANGGSGTKVILWTCNHGPDETWTHTGSDGEFVLGSKSHGRLCLADPGYSTTNRTQLIVSACRNTSNQHWT
jgi:Ricin-type beta-trefoil lectin domain